MLLHIQPRLYSPFRNVVLIGLEVKPLVLRLVDGVDLRTGRHIRTNIMRCGLPQASA
jgi:hypothetical protein